MRSYLKLLPIVCALSMPLSALATFEHVEGFEGGVIDPKWWEIDTRGPCDMQMVSSPVRRGESALRFDAGEGARCEIVHWPRERFLQWFRREPYHRDRWYGFSIYLPADRNLGDPERNEVVAQWHGSGDVWFFEPGGRGPPLALRIQGRLWRITFGSDSDLRSEPGVKTADVLWTGPTELGTWTDWVFHVVWSHEGDGVTEVWKNGEKVAEHFGPNAFNDLRGVYMKLGSYHPRADQRLVLDEVRVGNTREIVLPLLGPASDNAQ